VQRATSQLLPVSPTLQDVARVAGVSTATVSRCLNTPDRVVAQTRDRVLEAVRDLGYAPNFGARALAAKRTNTIGAIIPTMENAIFARGLQAFQEQLARDGYTLLVASSSYVPEVEEDQIRMLLARGADALLLIGFERSEAVYRMLHQRGTPFVIAWAFETDTPYPAIGFDNRAAMRGLARQVFAQGHRKVAIISAPRASNDRARARVEGIRDAARESGVDPATFALIETPYGIENGADALAQLMSRSEPPTAVMCGNDVLAVGALGMARTLGLSVPKELSITGFDDIELARVVTPKLTTVHVPHREMGQEAARMLAHVLGGGLDAESRGLETRIVTRGSLGKVPRRA
jgi:LacI family transcriptional regulator